jgi:type II secretory pathway predicted ATPase ExeA/pSer/pThr/pTyr-binding forkhead associated (FHA) protein
MYLELFKLKELPFRLSPDPQFLFLSKHHARAKAYMESTIWFTDGFVLITGEIGSGKTTLIESFLRELDRDVIVAQLNQTQISPLGFLQGLLVQFGFSPFKMNKAELLATINNFLIEQYAAGRKVVLVIDEAQNLSNRVLEEVRLLSGVETTKDKTLRIILAGQPELGDKLNSPELVQLAQRIRLRFHLTPLSNDETVAYIAHRLEVAGAEGRQIFTPDAVQLIFRYTGGVPRLVNTLCDTAMMSAFAADRALVDEGEVRAAIEELNWIEYASRTNRMARTEMVVPVLRAMTGDNSVLGRLTVTTKGRTVIERDLRPGRLIVGRTAENDIQIDSKYVSRHHCQITVALESVLAEDLNSTNGIMVKGKRVRRHLLRDGDVIVIGQHELRYADERPQGTRPGHESTPNDTGATGAHEDLSASAKLRGPSSRPH